MEHKWTKLSSKYCCSGPALFHIYPFIDCNLFSFEAALLLLVLLLALLALCSCFVSSTQLLTTS
jgi:hypothetical protein